MRTPHARSVACAAALASLIPFNASAAEQDIVLQATVSPSCTLNGSTSPVAMVTQIPVSNGVVSTAPISLDIPVVCNTAAAISVTTLNGGLIGPSTYFGDQPRIDYLATVSVPFSIPVSINTEQSPGNVVYEAAAPSQPPNGNINVTVAALEPSAPLLAGEYSDTIKITVAPSQ